HERAIAEELGRGEVVGHDGLGHVEAGEREGELALAEKYATLADDAPARRLRVVASAGRALERQHGVERARQVSLELIEIAEVRERLFERSPRPELGVGVAGAVHVLLER